MARGVDNPMYFYRLCADSVKNQIRIKNEDTITEFFEFWMAGSSTKMRHGFKSADALVKVIDKCRSSSRVVVGNPIING